MAVQSCRPAAAALIRPLAWKLPYATGTALKTTTKFGVPMGGEGVKVAQWVKETVLSL